MGVARKEDAEAGMEAGVEASTETGMEARKHGKTLTVYELPCLRGGLVTHGAFD
jgi:hypothetical protein